MVTVLRDSACCTPYYGCHRCHAECADHPAVACRVCLNTLRIDEYVIADDCPLCGAAFTLRCRLHHDLYFAPVRPDPAGPDPRT